jgi:hypothetical protein
MSNEILTVLLRQDRLVCWSMSANKVNHVLQCGLEPQALFAWLKNFSGKGVHVLIDLIEEEVYIDASPMLFPWEQDSFAVRQMRKRFPKTEFCMYRFEQQKALPWESRSGFLLVAGFNDDSQLVKLFSWLETAQNPVISVTSMGLLMPSLFKSVWFSDRSQLKSWSETTHFLLARTDVDSFRQALIVDGELRTARQIQLRDQSLEGQVQQLLQEIKMLDKFVHTQKIIPYNQTPNLYYLGFDQDDTEAAWHAFQDTPYITTGRSAFVSVGMLMPKSVEKLQINDRLHVLAFGSEQRSGDYSPKSVTESKKYQQINYALWFSLFIVVIGFFGYGAHFLATAIGFQSSMQSLQEEHAKYQFSINQLQSQLHLDVPVEQLKSSVELVDYLQKTTEQQDSLPYLLDLSEVLADYHMIYLSGLNWQQHRENQVKEPKLDETYYTLSLTAKIVVDSHTRLRDILNIMDRFVHDLSKKQSIKEVITIEKPIDLDSSRALKIMSKDESEKYQIYPFTLDISFKRKP